LKRKKVAMKATWAINCFQLEKGQRGASGSVRAANSFTGEKNHSDPMKKTPEGKGAFPISQSQGMIQIYRRNRSHGLWKVGGTWKKSRT